jgi:Glycosyl transferases group 1
MAGLARKAAAENSTIQWLGNVPLEAVYALVGEAAFLVAPSQCYETFSRVIMEAFAKGTPVIASRLGAMAEIGRMAARGCTSHLPRKPLELARMRWAARQKFNQNFTADSNHESLIAIYEQALSGRPRLEFPC